MIVANIVLSPSSASTYDEITANAYREAFVVAVAAILPGPHREQQEDDRRGKGDPPLRQRQPEEVTRW